MTDLTDTELDALAERLKTAWWTAPRASDFGPVAREAARYFAERERERLKPLRVAVEAHDRMCEKYENGDHEEFTVLVAHLDIARVKAVDAARTLLENTR